MDVNVEALVTISSFIGAVVSLLAAVAAWRIDIRREQRESHALELQESHIQEEHHQELLDQVTHDTVGLYQKLAAEYQSSTRKDREFLRKVTIVIRRLIVLQREANNILDEFDARWDIHGDEASAINCPFYNELNAYYRQKMSSLEDIISGTMDEVDTILLNGNGKDGTNAKKQ